LALAFIYVTGMRVPAIAETPNPCSVLARSSLTVIGSAETARVGDALTYSVTLANGSYDWGLADVFVHLPREARFVSAATSKGSWSYSGGVVRVSYDLFPAGTSDTVEIATECASPGKAECWAELGESESNWCMNYAEYVYDVFNANPNYWYADGIAAREVTTIIERPDVLSISSRAWPEPVVVGGSLEYRISVRNNSSQAVTGVVVTNDLPSGVNFVRAEATCGAFTRSASHVTWNLGTLDAAAKAALEIAVTPTAVGTLTNATTVVSSETDPDPSNNRVSATTQVVREDWPVMERIGSGLSAGFGNWRNLSISADGRFVGVGVPTEVPLLQTPLVFDRVSAQFSSPDVNDYGESALYPQCYLPDAWVFPYPGVYYPTLSSTGRFVSFVTPASNLVAADTNSIWDGFVRDRLAGTIERISETPEGWQMGWYFLDYPPPWECGLPEALYTSYCVLSGNGKQCLFGFAGHLYLTGMAICEVPADAQLHVKERSTGQIRLVERGLAWSDSGVAVSADGQYVAYGKAGAIGRYDQVLLRELNAGSSTVISVGSDGVEGNGDSAWPSVSGNGRYVAFWSDATDLVPNDTNNATDLFVRDCVAGVTERVSVSSAGEQANGPSGGPSISDDGRYVAFNSLADNLVSYDTNGVADVFVHDRQTGKTTLVSRSGVTVGNGASARPVISGNGRFVAFGSLATNLVEGDGNGVQDVYVVDWQRLPEPIAKLVNCGGPKVGGWGQDGSFTGGRATCASGAVSGAGPVPVAVYQTQRTGKFDYSLRDVPNGKYTVRLHFVEPTYTKKGCRAFDVYAENKQVVKALDVFAAAGGRMKALVKEVQVSVTDGNGLQLSFRPTKVDAIVCGIEIAAL